MALSFRRPQPRFLSNYPHLHRHFSSSSSNDHSTPQQDNTQTNPNLEQTQTTHLKTLKLNLAQYRKPQNQPPDSSQQRQPVSFEDSFHRNVTSNPLNGTSPPTRSKPAALSFDKIRESLKNIERKNPGLRNVSRGGIGNVVGRSNVIGGNQGLSDSILGKDVNKDGKESVLAEFRHYSHKDLGEKLRSLRPVEKSGEKGWFSLQELNERLKKLRELDLKNQPTVAGLSTTAMRDTLAKWKLQNEEQKDRKNMFQNLFFVGTLSSSAKVIEGPPKEHLLEKYFHPDNMSAEEKMKIELAKVRDEFKISESDCGSARVQVAQLTTKIKHLSTVLHKKDKHSRKGLQEMVQRRKKLLKYLRRTDWESYCFVISRLGLRDNPDFKETHKKRLSS